MKLVVLGASGGCGRALVREAHERGHKVLAVARASSTLSVPAGVDEARGDLTDAAFLTRILRGQDAVLSGLGLRLPGIAPWQKAEDPRFLERSTQALVAAMKEAGVRRVMAISAGGAGDSWSRMPLAFRAFVKGSALKAVYVELDKMEALLLASGLDVCICRPTGLTDGPRTGRGHIASKIAGRASISRADLAAWMLESLEAPAFPAPTPIITDTGEK